MRYRWPLFWFDTFIQSDREVMLERRPSSGNGGKRDRRLVEHCDGLLAFWDGGASPLWRTAGTARAAGMEVTELRI